MSLKAIGYKIIQEHMIVNDSWIKNKILTSNSFFILILLLTYNKFSDKYVRSFNFERSAPKF
jgi:hypothetical protein